MSINNSVLMGRITAEPELKKTQTDVSVMNFTIAVDRRYQPQGEEKKADFIDCVAWRNTADFISRYFRKGQMIAVVGELQTDVYTDKDGNKRKKVFISVENVSFCGSKTESGSEPNTPTPPPDDIEFDDVTDDELPF